MSLYSNTTTTSQVDESQDSEFTAASALACLARNDSNTGAAEEQDDDEAKQDFSIPQRFTKSGRKRAVPFTIKLMKVLSDKNNADIITWMPSGRSFNILKPKAFVADILPRAFKTAKYSSFTRKLHRWGFMRHYRGAEAGAFYHKDFQRGRLDLVEEMTCHKQEPPKSGAAISAATTFAAAPEALPRKALVQIAKPVALRPTPVPTPKKTIPTMTAAALVAPATPKVMPTLKMPTSLISRHQQHTHTPSMHTPSMVGHSVTSALPPMAPSLSGTPRTTATPSLAALESERLNAAIEREVNRRLQERINAVALSRQAYAVSALRQQQFSSMPAAPRRTSHSQHMPTHSSQWTALLLQKQAEMLKNTHNAGARMPLNLAPHMGYRSMASSEGQSQLPGAPPTNIQGARTA